VSSDAALSPLKHFCTRIFHLRGRPIYLTTWGLVSADFTTSHYGELLDHSDCTEHNTAGIDTAERQDQEKGEQDTVNNMTQREPGTPHSWLPGDVKTGKAQTMSTRMVALKTDT